MNDTKSNSQKLKERLRKVSAMVPDGAKCVYCGLDNDELIPSVSVGGFVHATCINKELDADPDNEEAWQALNELDVDRVRKSKSMREKESYRDGQKVLGRAICSIVSERIKLTQANSRALGPQVTEKIVEELVNLKSMIMDIIS